MTEASKKPGVEVPKAVLFPAMLLLIGAVVAMAVGFQQRMAKTEESTAVTREAVEGLRDVVQRIEQDVREIRRDVKELRK